MSLASRCLDVLYPPACAICRAPLRDGRYLCGSCHPSLPRISQPFCIRCGTPFDGALPEDVLCPTCRTQASRFEFARAPLRARNEALDLIHSFKYGRQIHLHRELAGLLAELWIDPRLSGQTDPPWTVIPVPLHWRRRQWRRFNQSFEMARALARLKGLRLAPVLRRKRDTPQQTLLSRSERLRNLKGAFSLSHRERRRHTLAGKPVLLIDDVFTTGSTAKECTRVLLDQGRVEKVVVLTVLRG